MRSILIQAQFPSQHFSSCGICQFSETCNRLMTQRVLSKVRNIETEFEPWAAKVAGCEPGCKAENISGMWGPQKSVASIKYWLSSQGICWISFVGQKAVKQSEKQLKTMVLIISGYWRYRNQRPWLIEKKILGNLFKLLVGTLNGFTWETGKKWEDSHKNFKRASSQLRFPLG